MLLDIKEPEPLAVLAFAVPPTCSWVVVVFQQHPLALGAQQVGASDPPLVSALSRGHFSLRGKAMKLSQLQYLPTYSPLSHPPILHGHKAGAVELRPVMAKLGRGFSLFLSPLGSLLS